MAVDKAEKQSERVLQRSSRLGAEEQTGAKGAARIPFEELYYYPGHSYSPLHDLLPPNPSCKRHAISSLHPIATLTTSGTDTDDEADPPGISLAFYTLRKNKQGGWDIVLVILEAEDGDERAEAMERCLYPGVILHLPSSLYISKSHTYFPLTPSSSSLSHRPTTPPLLVPDLQSSLHPSSQLIKLSFRHPAIPSAVADQARKEGVLGGWTRKEWGRAMRSGDTAIREWKSVMIRKLKSTDTK